MSVVVQKFGGSSVADTDKLGRVADRVAATRRAGHDVVVVVSAMGKTTDELLALARRVSPSPPRRELDMLLSTGERVAMALLSIAIQERGCEAISFTGSQSGILTDDRHFDARIVEVRPHRIEDELSRGKVVIVAGYQGVSFNKEVTTLGRGGSDTTALALAAALGAERCEVYSDVDGVYSADPRVAPDARHIGTLDYPELQEMAEAGAKVLNAQAVEFAKRAGIAIHARSTFAPGKETIVRRADPARKGPKGPKGNDGADGRVRAVVSESRLVRLTAERLSREAARALLEAAEEARVPLKELHLGSAAPGSADSTLSAVVSLLNVPDWLRARQSLLIAAPGLALDETVGAVSVVGDGINRDHEVLLRTLAIADSIGARPIGVTTTAFRISLLVARERVDDLVRALHAALVVSLGAGDAGQPGDDGGEAA